LELRPAGLLRGGRSSRGCVRGVLRTGHEPISWPSRVTVVACPRPKDASHDGTVPAFAGACCAPRTSLGDEVAVQPAEVFNGAPGPVFCPLRRCVPKYPWVHGKGSKK